MIGIVYSGLGNVAAVANILRRVGADSVFVSAPADLSGIDALVLPGVGAFDAGMTALSNSNLVEPIRDHANQGKPVLGICLGMQLLSAGSSEGTLPGLGLIDAHFERFDPAESRVPYIGWNDVHVTNQADWFGQEIDPRFYFTHSYYAQKCADSVEVLATAENGFDYVCAYRTGNVMGVQFHPEKSHRYGYDFFTSFVEWTCTDPA